MLQLRPYGQVFTVFPVTDSIPIFSSTHFPTSRLCISTFMAFLWRAFHSRCAMLYIHPLQLWSQAYTQQEPGLKISGCWYIWVLSFRNASASTLPPRGMAYMVDRTMTNGRTKNYDGTTHASGGEERREDSWRGRR